MKRNKLLIMLVTSLKRGRSTAASGDARLRRTALFESVDAFRAENNGFAFKGPIRHARGH